MIGTKIILEDNSVIPSIDIAESSNQPVIMAAFTSDKGTEDFIEVSGQEFFKQYGTNISFKRHGQPLLQAANAINNGAKLYCKRVVDPTSKLAMFGIIANVQSTNVQKQRIKTDPITSNPAKDEHGNVVYEKLFWKKDDVDNIPTPELRVLYNETDAGAEAVPATFPVAKINYTAETITDDFKGDAKAMAQAFEKKHGGKLNSYPLFIITENGRGVSNKKVFISVDTSLGKTAESCRYTIEVYEDGTRLESMIFSFNPDEIANGYNLFFDSVVKRSSSQIKCFGFEDSVYAFFDKVAEITGRTETEIAKSDIFNGCDYRGNSIENIEIVTEGSDGATTVNLCSINGLNLVGGENGDEFGNAPILNRTDARDGKLSTYDKEFEKVFNGEFSDEIYNFDNRPIDVIVDANYPDNVKRAISDLCNFRQDISYFRDLGFGHDNFQEIKNRKADFDSADQSTRYADTYCQTYCITDPYTYKIIPVTIGYSLVRLITMHWGNGRNLVLAGKNNGWTIPEMIEGTLNFTPKVTPAEDQQALMDELRINYGYYQQGVFTLATEYTSQPRFTQLSYINNVLLVQNLIKDIRIQCPKSRYKFITGNDFSRYTEDINNVIAGYSSKFDAIKMEWVQDAVYAANKIVYAIIKVKFKDFAQYEIFRIIAVPVGQNL